MSDDYRRNEAGDIHVLDLGRAIGDVRARYAPIPVSVIIKWNCPECGERCMADEANVFHAEGWHHTVRKDGSPCGGVYTGDYYGFNLLIGVPDELAEKIMDDVDQRVFDEIFRRGQA